MKYKSEALIIIIKLKMVRKRQKSESEWSGAARPSKPPEKNIKKLGRPYKD